MHRCKFLLHYANVWEGTILANAKLCRDFPMNQYTLPKVWDGVKKQVDYAAKQKEVEQFNRNHAWLKRGVAMTPTR